LSSYGVRAKATPNHSPDSAQQGKDKKGRGGIGADAPQNLGPVSAEETRDSTGNEIVRQLPLAVRGIERSSESCIVQAIQHSTHFGGSEYGVGRKALF
jgi:hypothetical protein